MKISRTALTPTNLRREEEVEFIIFESIKILVTLKSNISERSSFFSNKASFMQSEGANQPVSRGTSTAATAGRNDTR